MSPVALLSGGAVRPPARGSPTSRGRTGVRETSELYAAPLAEFIQRRDHLAARLRIARRPADAAAVRRLRKPTKLVWAINQLAHQAPGEVGAFLDGAQRVRRAQVRGGEDLDQALAAQRAALQRLTARATKILAAAGTTSDAPLLRRLTTTLLAAGADEQRHPELREGRLGGELPAPGFDALAGVPIRPRPRRHAPEPPRRTAQAPAPRQPADQREAAERQHRNALERAAAERWREAEETERQITETKKRLVGLRARLAEQRRAARARPGPVSGTRNDTPTPR